MVKIFPAESTMLGLVQNIIYVHTATTAAFSFFCLSGLFLFIYYKSGRFRNGECLGIAAVGFCTLHALHVTLSAVPEHIMYTAVCK